MTAGSQADLALAQVWASLRREARETRDAEPFLAPHLDRAVIQAPTLSDALAGLLAEALASREIEERVLKALILEVMDDDPSIAAAMALDIRKARADDPACGTHLQAFLNYKGLHALQAHRVAHRLWRTGRRDLAVWLSNRASRVLGPDIHPGARLGPGVLLDHGSGIVIGETAVVEADATILQNVTLGGTGKDQGDRHPKLRRGVVIGAGACIIGNIEIGAGSKVGAGSVVLKDIPPGCSVAGIPARIVRLHSAQAPPGDAPVGSGRCGCVPLDFPPDLTPSRDDAAPTTPSPHLTHEITNLTERSTL